MLLEFATANATVKVTTAGASANCVITSPGSLKVKDGGGVGLLRGPVAVSCSGGISGPCGTAVAAVGSGVINGSSKHKADSLAIVRKGDGATINMIGQQPNPPGPPIPCNFSMDIEIDDPAQTKVTGE